MDPHLWWYVARASGIVGWALVTASVVYGLWVSLRLTRRRPRPAWVLDLHRFLGGLSVVFVGVHLAGLAADSYAHFGLGELLVPFASSWKPTAVAWGIVGVYLLVAVEATSLLMRRLPRRLWRAIHLSSYGIFAVSTIHMFTAGTDAGNAALQWSAVAGTTAVVFLTVTRVLSGRPARRQMALPTATERTTQPVPVA
ncbi:MAG TPA: ferric reductase-like transmembrane domain-containing protein [Acidimicrobiia bacterium]|nr:ferric reductase-like transmembrane domain-containing protein [Acidimicrobiia bacterium]